MPDEALKSSNSRDKEGNKICPVVLNMGCYWEEGDLVVRQPDREVRLRVSQVIWHALCKACDGRNTFEQVCDLMASDGAFERRGVEDLIAALWNGRILVDAADLMIHCGTVAQSPSGWGLSIPQSRWPELISPLLPSSGSKEVKWLGTTGAAPQWKALSSRRRSTSAWRLAPLRDGDLEAILRCYAAVANVDEGAESLPRHRAVASAGGLYRLKLFLILLVEADGLAAGVYEVAYGDTGGVGTRWLQRDVEPAYRACLDPGLLRNATGWLILAADVSAVALKYRNLAYAHVHVETGLVLQNFSLICGEVGLGQCVVGGYDSTRVKALCHCDGLAIVGSAVFGVPLIEEDQVRPTMPWDGATITWYQEFPDLPDLPYHLAIANLDRSEKSPVVCVGRDERPRVAFDKALSELIERCGMHTPAASIKARYRDLSNAIHPHSILKYSPAAVVSGSFPFSEFDVDRPYEWVSMQSYKGQQQVWMLKDFCFADPRSHGADRYAATNSSGMACAPSEEMALCNATLELIERDAFMRMWLTQSSPPLLPDSAVAADVRDLIAVLGLRHCKVEFRCLESAFAPVCMVVVRSGAKPMVFVSACAASSWVDAARHALREIITVALTKISGEKVDAILPEQVRGPQDHLHLYCQAAYVHKLDFLSRNQEERQFVPEDMKPLTLPDLALQLENAGFLLYWHRIDTPHAPRYMDGSAPIVVRAIAPGLVPMTFGGACVPWLGDDVNHPDSAFPHPFP